MTDVPPVSPDPWQVQEHDYPAGGEAAAQLRHALRYAVLAPSSHNTQPWRFHLAQDRVQLFADRTRALAVIDPMDRQLVMSCGAALFHLRVALRHYGHDPRVALLPDTADPDLMAEVRLGTPRTASIEEHRMFMAIKKRRTNRQAFESRAVPPQMLDRLVEVAAAEGVQLYTMASLPRRAALAALIAEGDRVQGNDPSFRRELAAWTHSNRSRSRDGIPGYAHGWSDLQSLAEPLLIRTFDWGDGRAAHDRQLAEGSPALLVFTTQADQPLAWLHLGQALAHVLLLAADYGLSASYLNQPIEVSTLRGQVATETGAEGHPQLILRIGYGPPLKPTPRRPLTEVLTEA